MINNCIRKTNDKTNIINYIKVENIDIYECKQIADEMGNYFLTIGSKYANDIPQSNTYISDYLSVIPRNPKCIFFTPANRVEIEKIITNLPNKKSSGFDNIDNIILKSIKNVISDKLSSIFNESMLNGIFPE